MFLAFLYSPSNSEKSKLPSLWWFYKLVHSFAPDEIMFIADSEDYFSDPAKLDKESYHGIGDDEQEIYEYLLPSFQKINQYQKVFFDLSSVNDDDRVKMKEMYSEYNFKTDFTYNGLVYLSVAYSTVREMGISPEALLYNSDMGFSKAFCEKNRLPYVSMELGPLRKPLYASTALFAIGGIYSIEILNTRYERFKEELILTTVPMYANKEIFSIFLENKYEDELDDCLPEYDLGVAFPYSFGPRKKDFDNLLNIAQNFTGSVICRSHPTDYNNAEIERLTIDNSENSLDFIKKCKRIISCGSNITLEALLLSKVVFDTSNAQFSWLAHKTVSDTLELSCDLTKYNFYIFGYLVPYEYCFNKEYIRWRLSNPSEIDIYSKNLEYYKKLRGNEFNERLERVKEDLTLTLEGSIINQLTKRKTSNKKEIENLRIELNNRNAHIELLLESERQLKKRLLYQDNDEYLKLEQLNIELTNRKGHIELLLETERQLKNELANKYSHIEQLLETERNLSSQIEQLAESEKRLNDILASKTWKIVSSARRFIKLLSFGRF